MPHPKNREAVLSRKMGKSLKIKGKKEKSEGK
jgi:hypothetical protein